MLTVLVSQAAVKAEGTRTDIRAFAAVHHEVPHSSSSILRDAELRSPRWTQLEVLTLEVDGVACRIGARHGERHGSGGSQASGKMVNGVFVPAPPGVTIDANFRLRGHAR